MAKVNSNNGNETKADNFLWGMCKSDIVFHQFQNAKILMTFMIGIFQFHCKSEDKQVK